MKKLNRSLLSTLFLSLIAFTNVSYADLNVVYDYIAPKDRDYENNIYMFEPTFSRYTQPLTFLEDLEKTEENTYWFIRTEMQKDPEQTKFHLYPDVEKFHRASGKTPIDTGTEYMRFAFYEAHALLSVGMKNRNYEFIPRDNVSEYLLKVIKGEVVAHEIKESPFSFTATDRHTNQKIIKFELYKIEKDSKKNSEFEDFVEIRDRSDEKNIPAVAQLVASYSYEQANSYYDNCTIL